MSRLPNEDLFEGSKMTFGEHLEELRTVLFKCMLGLAIGVLVGFFFVDKVIDMIETPLIKALDNYYSIKMSEEIGEQYGRGMSDEELVELKDSVMKDGRVFENVYFERNELKRLLGLLSESPAPADATNDEASGQSTEQRTEPGEVGPGRPDMTDMVKTRIWKSTGYKIQSIGTTEPFIAYVKVAIITGLTIAMPWIFYQLWVFVAEGLYPSEKKYVYIYMPFSLGLFAIGASIAFFFVFEPVLQFLFSFNVAMNSDPEPRISEWLSFFMLLPLGFGVGFQLPLVMLFLNRIGIVTVETYLSQWRIAVLIIFCASMLLTPADPTSMLLLAIPLTILYFLGIALCHYLPQRESPFGEGYEPS